MVADLIPCRLLLHQKFVQNDKFAKKSVEGSYFFHPKVKYLYRVCTPKKWRDLCALKHLDKLTDFEWEHFSVPRHFDHFHRPGSLEPLPLKILIEYFCDPQPLRQEHHQRAVFVESPGQRNHWHLCQHLCPFKVWLLEILATSHTMPGVQSPWVMESHLLSMKRWWQNYGAPKRSPGD